MSISVREYDARAARLLESCRAEQLAGAAFFDNYHVAYLTGFFFVPTERPIGLVMSAAGDRVLLVPRLELEHARAEARVDRVESYAEYPGQPHPMVKFTDILRELGLTGWKRLGADHDGYPWILGYQGPTLASLTDCAIVNINPAIEKQMAVKSAAELALIRESCKWGNLAHRLLFRYTRVGANEVEVSRRAGTEATLAMVDALGPLYRSGSMWHDGATAGYRGQIGRNASIPHSLTTNATFMAGDVLVTGANAPMWGYNSEVERTMVIGEPSADQKRFFAHMLAVQEIALEALKPGVPCSAVDRAVRAYFEQQDLMPFWRHHSGHAIGLRYHEGPFLDSADDTVIEPGMVFTVEPGLYVPDLGGFRHSETTVVTEDGNEMLTYFPRDLASLTIVG